MRKKSLIILNILFVLFTLIRCSITDTEVEVPKKLVASFTYVKESSPAKIAFINTSDNANSYAWDFGDNTSSIVKDPIKTYSKTGNYEVKLTAKNTTTGDSSIFKSTVSVVVSANSLIINGDFEAGTSPWTLGIDNAISTNLIISENNNKYFSIPVTAAGNPFDVNLSQKGLKLTQGTKYRLTFDAWAGVNRSIVVGIGLSGDPWTNNSVSKNLTTTKQNFSIDLEANFSNDNSRVIFDMGAAIGTVNIDNVTLVKL